MLHFQAFEAKSSGDDLHAIYRLVLQKGTYLYVRTLSLQLESFSA